MGKSIGAVTAFFVNITFENIILIWSSIERNYDIFCLLNKTELFTVELQRAHTVVDLGKVLTCNAR